MRLKLCLVLYVVVSFELSAQMKSVLNYQEIDERPLHFGFVLGLNACDFDITLSQVAVDTGMFADVTRLVPGFHVGIVSNLRLNDYMDFRVLPGMSFGSRWIYYYIKDGTTYSPAKIERMRADYYPIEVPFKLKLKSDRINNYRPYLFTNFTLRYDMSSSKKFAEEEDKLIRYIIFKPFDYYYGFGVGVDYYFEFFKLSTEIGMDFGQRDILKHEPHAGHPEYTTIMDKVKSNMVYLSFCFE